MAVACTPNLQKPKPQLCLPSWPCLDIGRSARMPSAAPSSGLQAAWRYQSKELHWSVRSGPSGGGGACSCCSAAFRVSKALALQRNVKHWEKACQRCWSEAAAMTFSSFFSASLHALPLPFGLQIKTWTLRLGHPNLPTSFNPRSLMDPDLQTPDPKIPKHEDCLLDAKLHGGELLLQKSLSASGSRLKSAMSAACILDTSSALHSAAMARACGAIHSRFMHPTPSMRHGSGGFAKRIHEPKHNTQIQNPSPPADSKALRNQLPPRPSKPRSPLGIPWHFMGTRTVSELRA